SLFNPFTAKGISTSVTPKQFQLERLELYPFWLHVSDGVERTRGRKSESQFSGGGTFRFLSILARSSPHNCIRSRFPGYWPPIWFAAVVAVRKENSSRWHSPLSLLF